MKILVTGGTGFVGKELVKLLTKKHEVRCLVRRKRVKNAENWVGDLTDKESLKGICEGIRVVIHLATVGEVNAVSKRHYEKCLKTNVQGLKNLLRECEGVERIIMLSSLIVKKPYHSAYGDTKKMAEEVLTSSSLPHTIIRVPLICDWKEPKGEFKRIVKMVKRGYIFMLDHGRYSIDFVSRNKVVREILKEVETSSKCKRKVIEIVGESLNFNEFVERVMEKYEKKKVKRIKLPFVLVSPFIFLVDLFARFFGFVPPISFGRAKYLHEQDKNAPAGI